MTEATAGWTRPVAAIAVGLAAAALGTWVWVAANYGLDVEMGWLAVPIGIAIGSAVAIAAGPARRAWVSVLAAGLTVVTMLLAQNFLQRELLDDGIAALQEQWDDLRVDPAADDEAGEADAGRPAGAGMIPPPSIVAVMPIEAYAEMEPDVLVAIWDDVPADIMTAARQQFPDLVAAAEGIRSGASAEGTDDSAGVEAARARYEATEDEYDIPRPVAACASPPDFTQPDAASGLGFGDGVPLILPLSDLLAEPPERGDGMDYEAPSPWCFGWENAIDQPTETASWLVGIGAAAAVPWGLRRRRTVERGEPDGRA